MAQSIEFAFEVDDTSPFISYLPFRDTFPRPNLSAGWNPYYDVSGFPNTLGAVGNGTSFHTTSSNGATMSLQWKGTGIRLFGNANSAGYDILLDGSSPSNYSTSSDTLAAFQNLPNDDHNITLITRISDPQSYFYFDKAVIIASVTLPPSVPSTNSLDRKLVEDSNLVFSGNWDPSGDGSRLSTVQNDTVEATFQGVAFFLTGMTSPKSGTYSVTLDNHTTILSAQSSFMQVDSLLYFASGLDPMMVHNLKIVNVGGQSLSLAADGFEVLATASPPPSQPLSDEAAPAVSHPKGTIAAEVLAGILAFIIITGILFFFFVVRPRRQRIRRERLERQERRRKQREAGAILDIAPMPADIELASVEASPDHGSAGGISGFSRWKREVEGGLNGLGIGIAFRHSDSSNGKAPGRFDVECEPPSVKSSIFTTSSKQPSKGGKGKGKKKTSTRQTGEGSRSPRFALKLPARSSSSMDSQKEKDMEEHKPDAHYSLSSGLTSLSYMSIPSQASESTRLAPPSYTPASRGLGNVSPHPFTRSAVRSTPDTHRRRGSQGLLLNDGAPNPDDHDGEPSQDHEPFVSSLAPPDTQLHLPSTGRDRGSAQYSSDDTQSVLGSAATRLALRGLSPRIEVAESKFVAENLIEDKAVSQAPQEIPIQPRASSSKFQRKIMESPLKWEEQENAKAKNKKVMETLHNSDSFLTVRPPSPFKVDFAKSDRSPTSSKRDRMSTRASASFVKFEDDTEETKPEQERPETLPVDQEPEAGQSSKGRSHFRLTPPSKPRPTKLSAPLSHKRSGSASFIDFSTSSDSSYKTHSAIPSEFSEGDRQWTTLPTNSHLQSRWSNTLTQSTDLTRSGTRATDASRLTHATNATRSTHATDLSRSDSSGVSLQPTSPASAPRSVFSASFPYPVSLPPSPHHPEGHQRPASPPAQTWHLPEHMRSTSDEPAPVHPFEDIASPTDSVPMSVSEIKFRHSGSTAASQNSARSHLPPHPPLPSRDDTAPNTPGFSTPHYIVQRVLGHTPNASASGFGVSASRSQSGSPTLQP